MHRLLVLYGSQTGTAADLAEQIWRKSKRYGFKGPVMAMDDYDIEQLVEEQLVVFVVATTGDGDAPDNMSKFWKFLLRRTLPTNLLQQLNYACFGLGDSSYTKYNYAAKRLHKRLQNLGAKSLLPLCLGDDQHDYGPSAAALHWMQDLWQQLFTIYTDINQQATTATADVSKWNCDILPDISSDINADDEQLLLLWPHRSACLKFQLLTNRRITASDHWQDVRLLQFGIPDGVRWSPGDILLIHPHNLPQQIDLFFRLVEEHNMDFRAETVVRITSMHSDISLPKCYTKPLTVRQLVTYIWDLNAMPRQRVFELLALNCEDDLEKEKLIEFTTMEGLDDLINYINRPRRNILEVLQDFPNATSKLTLNLMLEIFSFIQPRSFSIASCWESKQLDLLVAVVKYKTKLSLPRLGLCSNWLKALNVNEEVFASIKPGTLKIPKDPCIPLIMIGPGTGLAPLRSIIQQRYLLTNSQLSKYNNSKLFLFFGCRNRNKDYHFQSDLEEWQAKNFLELYVAFSRDQECKVYVQHLIENTAKELRTVIHQENAVILVSGSSKDMPKAVKDAFINILQKDDALIEEMIKSKRYQQETWS